MPAQAWTGTGRFDLRPDAYVLSTYALGDKRDVASRFKDLQAAARAIVNAMPR